MLCANMKSAAFLILLSINTINSSLISEMFQLKNLKNGISMNCDCSGNKIQTQKNLLQNGIELVHVNFEENAIRKLPISHSKIGVVLNTSCEGWDIIFWDTNDTYAFGKNFVWFIFTDNLTESVEMFSQYPIEVNSDVTLIFHSENNTELYEIYNSGFFTNGSIHVVKKGEWEDSRLTLYDVKRMNMSGVVIKCMSVVTTAMLHESFNHYLDVYQETNGRDTLNKLKFFTLLKYLRDMYHFTYEIKRTKSWGYPRNGTFDGMVGALQRGEIELGASPIFFWMERAKVIDYTIQTWHSKQVFLLRHPKRLGAFYTIFTRPLSSQVWYSMMSLILLAGVFLCALLKFKALRKAGDEPDSSGSLAFLSVWSAVCQQGMSVNRNSTTIHIVVFSTFMFSLTIYQYYNALVVSSLLREPPKNIRTLEDLTKSDLKAGIENYPFNVDYFKRTTNPTAIKLFNEKIITKTGKNFFDLNTGMAMVKRGGFAFHVDSSSGYDYLIKYFTEQEICEIQEVQMFPPMNMVSAIRRGSPYREIITYGLRRMYEVGIFHRIRLAWDKSRPDCVRTPDATIFSVSIREASMPFIALLLGVVLAVFVLLCEVVMFRYSEKSKVIAFKH